MNITLLVTSDTHGFIEPTNYVDVKRNKPFGLEKASSVIKEYVSKHQSENTIIIDNGDFLEGSPLTYYCAKIGNDADLKMMCNSYNSVGYTIGSIGNHEFDYGIDYLKKAMEESNRKFICANIVDNDGNPLLGKPYEIIDTGKIKVGFLGLTTTAVRKWKHIADMDNFNFISEIDAANRYVPEMRKKADVVVVVYHGGFERDRSGNWNDINPGENMGYDILKQVKGIDAFISGHQHRKIASKLFNVPIVQPGSRGEFVGKVQLSISNTDKKVKRAETELISVANEPIDAEIAKTVKPLSKSIQHWLDRPLSRIRGDLTFSDPAQARMVESAYIEFIQKIQMDKMGVDISATALYNNEAHGFENPITMRNIMTNYVYPNTLAVSEISGADLRGALEITAGYFAIKFGKVTVNEQYLFPKERYYNYDMYEGIEYTLDISKPVGHRVTELKYHEKNVLPDQKLRVVLNKYRASGGGHYPMFTADKIVATNDTPISEIIREYLTKHPVITSSNNYNFKVIPKE